MRELDALGLDALGITFDEARPLHVLALDRADRLQSDRVVCHVWSGRVPAGSFYQIAPGLMVASPAFCCLQMAHGRSVAEATQIQMECLGSYGRSVGGRGFADREPLLTKAELSSYLDDAEGRPGTKVAHKALLRTVEGSRSPMETKVFLILTLPVAQGGYGLPKPELNYVIKPLPEELKVSQYATYMVDGCWPKRRVIYEYDSYAEHLNRDTFNRDAMKWNSLKSMGWKVTRITNDQLSGAQLDTLAYQLAKDLGVAPKHPEWMARERLLESLK